MYYSNERLETDRQREKAYRGRRRRDSEPTTWSGYVVWLRGKTQPSLVTTETSLQQLQEKADVISFAWVDDVSFSQLTRIATSLQGNMK